MSAAPAPDDNVRRQMLNAFADDFGLPPIEAIIQHGTGQLARYTLRFAGGQQVRVPNVDTLASRAKMHRLVLASLRRGLRPGKAGEWTDAISVLIEHASTLQDTPGESFEETVAEWVKRYAHGARNDRDGAAPNGSPFIDDGQLHISANELARYVRREFSEPVKLHDLRVALADLHFERITIHYRRANGKTSSTSYYRIATDTLEAT